MLLNLSFLRSPCSHPRIPLLANTLIAAFSGILASLNFAPYFHWYIGVASLALVFHVLSQCTWRQSTLYLLAFWFFYSVSSVIWVRAGISAYFELSALWTMLLTLIMIGLYSIFLCLPMLILCRFVSSAPQRLALLPLIWILGEYSRYWVFDGITWHFVGYGHQSSPLGGWIPVFGALGASFFASASSSLLASLFQKFSSTKLIGVTLSLALIWLGGWALKSVVWTDAAGESIPVTLIQPHDEPNDRPPQDSIEGIFKYWTETMASLSEEHWGQGLLIWPENTLQTTAANTESEIARFDKRARTSGTAFIAGGDIYPDPSNSDVFYNSALGLGQAQGLYHKVKMAPFGEPTQITQILDWIFRRPPQALSGFDRVTQPPIHISLNDSSYKASLSICYEIAFGNNIRLNTANANMMINLSSDVAFNGTHEPDQALQMAQIRALEHQKPFIRSAESGLSAIIDHRGNIQQQTAREQMAILSGDITPRSGQTPYTKFGDRPIFGLAILLCGFACFYCRAKESKALSNPTPG